MSNSLLQIIRVQLGTNRRGKIVLVLVAALSLVIIAGSKTLVRNILGSHPETAATGPRAWMARLTDEQWETLGFIAADSPVTPLTNPIAAERYREYQRVARVAKRRRSSGKQMESGEDQTRVGGNIARRPFVFYVAVAAVAHFLLGFVCAMQLGYRPMLFGKRISLSELDPFPTRADPFGGAMASVETTAGSSPSAEPTQGETK